jgi:hypothetical protein
MADEDNLGVVTISAREIYNEIVGMRDDLRSLAQARRDDSATLDDHETRIRSVERWKYGIPVTAVASVVAVIEALAQK